MPELFHNTLNVIQILLITMNVAFCFACAGAVLAGIVGLCIYRTREKKAAAEAKKKEEEAKRMNPFVTSPFNRGNNPFRPTQPSLFDDDDDDDDDEKPKDDGTGEKESAKASFEDEAEEEEKARRKKVYDIPENATDGMERSDPDLKKIVDSLPTEIILPDPPSKEYIERCKAIYIKNCFCYDRVGEILVQKALEYASTSHTRPLVLCGSPGCGKSHRAVAFAEMLGLPYVQVNIPAAASSMGLNGCAPPYKPTVGMVVKGMIEAKSCNFVLNSEEPDKEEKYDGKPSFSDQFLKLLDQDATHFKDNRLGFPVDASYIVHVFTANDVTKMSRPMLDRCDVIEVHAPSKSEMRLIIANGVIPKTIASFNSGDRLSFSEEAVDHMLHALWRGEKTSIRQYQNLVSKCLSVANYDSISEGRAVTVEADDVKEQLSKMSVPSHVRRRIGFV